jgi:ABC-type polysaccharide/polyol phosphate export permease
MFIRAWLGRYRSSKSAVVISMVAPLVQVLVMTFAVRYILNAGPANLSVYILCASIPYGFFQASIMSAFSSIDAMQPMVKRMYFPREIFVITDVSINFVQMLFALGAFLVYRYGIMTLISGWPGLPPHEVFLLPALLLLTYLLTLGIALFTSAVFFYFEDVRFMINLLLNLMFYLMPILYFAENINYTTRIGSASLRWWIYHLYLANPMAWIVTAFKQMFFGQQIISARGASPILSAPFDYRYFAITTLTTLLIFALSYLFFNRMKWKFAERP